VRQKIASIAQRLRIPAVCPFCSHYHRGKYAACDDCSSLLVHIGNACTICCLPLTDNIIGPCGNCIKQKPAFDQVITAYCFEEPLRTFLHEFKYKQALYLRSFMVKLMCDALTITSYTPGCLVPVPMHAKRLKERGFNQAAELTKLLARKMRLTYDLTLCEKTINTVPQVYLNAKQRKRNLHQGFRAYPTAHRHITLIDDLLTTGSTADELALILKKQGVEKVDVWCLARTAQSK